MNLRPALENRFQAIITACIASYFTLIVFNNVTDFETNHWCVKSVLGMEGIWTQEVLYRAVKAPWMVLTAYISIIATESAIALLLWVSALSLWLGREAKAAALLGFGLAFALFMLGFVVIGGEWFYMWQHPKLGGMVPKATSLSTLMLMCFGFFFFRREQKK